MNVNCNLTKKRSSVMISLRDRFSQFCSYQAVPTFRFLINESSSDRSPGPSWLICLGPDSLRNLFVMCEAENRGKEPSNVEENKRSHLYSSHQYNLV